MAHMMLHTAALHRDRFKALRDAIAPGTPLSHKVRPDLLATALDQGPEAVRDELARLIAAVDGPVICTCTTLGPLAEELGARRIDTPMMEEAARLAAAGEGTILLAYCLDSTLAPSVDLLDRALAVQGRKTQVHTLSLAPFWALFEAGQQEAFEAVIATQLREAAKSVDDLAVIVLAQASMAGAAPRLADIGTPVLASPEIGLRAFLDLG
ncbi:hypothetical protein ACM25N_13170 [Roseovarius sp. C7]|uniref:hypothetical protein n=1 Tax=Roseovarius sp. C7 TaxID=3398643 RepID=UPI0039F6F941